MVSGIQPSTAYISMSSSMPHSFSTFNRVSISSAHGPNDLNSRVWWKFMGASFGFDEDDREWKRLLRGNMTNQKEARTKRPEFQKPCASLLLIGHVSP
jgi:hypothetical protein